MTLTLVPTIFAMHIRPAPPLPGHAGTTPGVSVVFELSGQLEQALIGLVLSLILLAIILNRFITRYEETADLRRLEAKSAARCARASKESDASFESRSPECASDARARGRRAALRGRPTRRATIIST